MILLDLILGGGALAGISMHIVAYKNIYARMIITFGTTFILKRVLNSAGAKTHSDLISLAGYSLTASLALQILNSILSKFKG